MGRVTNIKIVLNGPGIEALLKSEGMQRFIQGKAEAIAASARAAGGEYEASTIVGRTRARGSVITSDLEARKAQSENQALSRAGYAAGGIPGGG